MTSLVVRRVINGGRIKLKAVPVGPKKLIGGGVLKPERIQVICPACGQRVEAVASDGRVKGYCAIAKRYVDFLIETKLERKSYRHDPEYRAKMSAAIKQLWQDPEYRAKMSAAIRQLWQDPEYRAKHTATQIGKHPTAKHRAKISAALKRRHNERKPSH